MPFSTNPNSCVALRRQEHWWWGNRDSTRDLASDQSIASGWHDLQAAKRSEEWSATHRKKVAAETVFDWRALQFERACNRSSVVWLCRGLTASQKRNVARIIGSAGARSGTHRLHRIGGWLKGSTRSRMLTKSRLVHVYYHQRFKLLFLFRYKCWLQWKCWINFLYNMDQPHLYP